MSVVRVVFFGTPEFACPSLQVLLNDDHYQVVGVVTQPDRLAGRKMQLQPSRIKQLALAHNIEVITPEIVSSPDALEKIKSWKAEAAVVVAYGQIVSQEFLDLFPNKVVNIHGSLLPRWRGAAPIQRAIMAGDTLTGVSLQVMVRKLDAGAVIGERRIEITPEMDALELHDKLKVMGADLLHIEFMEYLRGHLLAKEQDESLVTHAAKIEKSESLIDWSLSAEELSAKVRGLRMGPGSYTTYQEKKLKIHQIKVLEQDCEFKPGEVCAVHKDHFVVACAKNCVQIYEVQPESKAKLTAADFIRGYQLQKNSQLG